MSTAKNKNKIIEFIVNNKDKLIICLIGLLISFISFEVGVLQGAEWKQDPVVIEKVSENQVVKLSDKGKCLATSKAETKVLGVTDSKNEAKGENGECLYVGSKNSDKIHTKDCQWATRIKESNRVCFSNVKDAQASGYVAGSCMK
ncbi:hypothetical protein ACFL16_02950 [Patescibacteria group bacterium]